jgi:hypothetical protein
MDLPACPVTMTVAAAMVPVMGTLTIVAGKTIDCCAAAGLASASAMQGKQNHEAKEVTWP